MTSGLATGARMSEISSARACLTSSSVTSLPKRVRRKAAMTRAATAVPRSAAISMFFQLVQRFVVQLAALLDDGGDAFGQFLGAAGQALLEAGEKAAAPSGRLGDHAVRVGGGDAGAEHLAGRGRRCAQGRNARCGRWFPSRPARRTRARSGGRRSGRRRRGRLRAGGRRVRGAAGWARRACGRRGCRGVRCRGRRGGTGKSASATMARVSANRVSVLGREAGDEVGADGHARAGRRGRGR